MASVVSVPVSSFWPVTSNVTSVPAAASVTVAVTDDGGVNDGGADSVAVAFEVRVRGVEDAPRASDDEAETDEDVPARIYVMANDREVDGDLVHQETIEVDHRV